MNVSRRDYQIADVVFDFLFLLPRSLKTMERETKICPDPLFFNCPLLSVENNPCFSLD